MQRWLVLSHFGGESDTYVCPDWYPTTVIAKHYHITPEEAMDMSVYWKDRTLLAIAAESKAREIISKQPQS